MSTQVTPGVVVSRPIPTRRLSDLLEREGSLGLILMAPAISILALFIAYPFLLGIWYSLINARIGVPGTFVGLDNFIPTALSTLAWLWIFDSTYGIISWVLKNVGLIQRNVAFLGDPTLAMGSVIAVNIWRGTPFFAISLLASLQTIPQDLYEAAAIDGAGAWDRFRRITLPLMMPVLTIVTLFSIIWTFADFQLVYVLTRGGPTNSTHLLATLAYQIGMSAGELSLGAAVSLWMFPFMAALVIT